jgi:hypothetical protein
MEAAAERLFARLRTRWFAPLIRRHIRDAFVAASFVPQPDFPHLLEVAAGEPERRPVAYSFEYEPGKAGRIADTNVRHALTRGREGNAVAVRRKHRRMRIQAEPFDCGQPAWRPYDAARLAALAAPEPAIEALTGRGLPDDVFDQFVRVPERELQALDGFNNTYWLSLADGSVWMRYGRPDEPVHHMKRINTSVPALQAVLAVYDAYLRAENNELDEQAREDLINGSIIHAVAADPAAFPDEENWWPQTFLEIEFSSLNILRGDRSLFQLVTQDAAGRWGLDHPGYEEEN